MSAKNNNKDFSNKVVIITGSSSGIGQSAAVLFAKLGASITIHGRSEAGLKKTIDLILNSGISKDRIHSVRGDITNETVLKSLIDETIKKFGKIDVLINNVGLAGKEALIDETIKKFGKIDVLINNVGLAGKEGEKNPRSMENLDYILNVNLKSIIALTELAIPHLEKTKGNIVNVSSILSTKPSPSMAYYCISKAALDHFARNYAAILAPSGIRINNLNPGATETSFLPRTGVPEEMMKKMNKAVAATIPLGRWGNSEEMAEFLAFIASEKASYMTGQIINVDGGILIASPPMKFD
uniref:Uncharacterized protein n=1 Tax=Panagrolaimus sp. PS1159 TaxID=55785 RepID=A0AC35FCM0_9BILA